MEKAIPFRSGTILSTAVVGEFLGTLVLILLGGGVVAGVLLERSKAKGAGWIVVTSGWAFAVTLGIFVARAFGAPGALNPVGPLADIVLGKGDALTNLAMIGAEVVGAFCGAMLVWLHFLPHWKATEDPAAKLGVFCTAPAIRSPAANVLSELIGTFALVFIASSIARSNPSASGEPPLVGLVVWAIGLSLGGTTGYAINPARDFGPRLAHALLPIAGKRGSDWGYAWVPIVGPCVGGVLGALAFKALSTLSQ
jgi:glycerol uptake facilitator protein